MSAFTFRPAKRENVPLLIGVAGGTGSGKTMSALRLARGLADGQPFAGIDTENRRMNHYADLFPELQVAQITAPFRPEKYAEAIHAAAEQFTVVVVDSMSHEWAGEGGCLDWHDDLMAGDQKKNLSAWILPKKSHKALVTRLLQVNAHVILCFRAEPKVESITENGRTKIIPKASLTGLDGWLPIAEKNLPYELTASFLLMADRPGVPKPIKLQEQHRPLVPLDAPLSEDVGRALAAWAAGGQTSEREPQARPVKASGVSQADGSQPASPAAIDPLAGEADGLAKTLLAFADTPAVKDAIAANRADHTTEKHIAWLKRQIGIAEKKTQPFEIPESARV